MATRCERSKKEIVIEGRGGGFMKKIKVAVKLVTKSAFRLSYVDEDQVERNFLKKGWGKSVFGEVMRKEYT